MESGTERNEHVNKLHELKGKNGHLLFGTAVFIEKRVC